MFDAEILDQPPRLARRAGLRRIDPGEGIMMSPFSAQSRATSSFQ
jgi:hypothetical protein